jgi:hypothetical protein
MNIDQLLTDCEAQFGGKFDPIIRRLIVLAFRMGTLEGMRLGASPDALATLLRELQQPSTSMEGNQ